MRIHEDARKTVVFFGVQNGSRIEYRGTGFLVLDQEQGVELPFLVTCRHVALRLQALEKFFIRINTREGGSEEVVAEGFEWSYPDDLAVDLAAVSFGIRGAAASYYAVHLEGVLEPGSPSGVMAGDPISLIGLFRLHPGSKRNIPIVHTGNVAVLPNEEERVPVRKPHRKYR